MSGIFTWKRGVAVRALWGAAITFRLAAAAEEALVFQTDFGTKDGAVAAMKGVAFGVSATLKQFDLTHEIEPFNIWEGACRLRQTAPYWPAGTVFVSVVDPGVGTSRRAVVLKTNSGHYFVSPDNGTLTLVALELGVAELRELDAGRHRRPGSEESHTFHGRDIFAFVGARLASGALAFADVGPRLEPTVVSIPHQKAELDAGVLKGCVAVLDVQYGNVWSNISKELFEQWKPKLGDEFEVRVYHGQKLVYTGRMPYAASFGYVKEGKPLLYLNSLLELALAVNQGDFARKFHIKSGPDWRTELRKI